MEIGKIATLRPPKLAIGESLNFAYENFCSNKVRFSLTVLGMVIGTASLILVVTIALTGKQYVLNQIQSIGANMIDAEYSGDSNGGTPDQLTMQDMYAVQEQVPGVVAASPVVPLDFSMESGKVRQLRVLAVVPQYDQVRRLVVLSGRFFDQEDAQSYNKVGVVQKAFAEKEYGSVDRAVGQQIRLGGLPFTIIGTFREAVNTFGQSEVTDNTMLIPYSVGKYFNNTPYVSQLYFSAASPDMVEPVTEEVRRVIQSRHRPESTYVVQNLTQVLSLARSTADILTIVLLLVAAITLFVGGIGIMNIMLATVSTRIREIGIRKAVGATKSEIRFQFLSEAVLISFIGGIIGVLIGLALPFSMRYLTDYRIPISGLSAIIAVVVSCTIGVLFGTVPAVRASQLDPVESLRYE